MDWDELKPKSAPGIAVGEDLTTMSVAELEARVAAFEAEIQRVKAELGIKQARQSAAAELFKR